MSIVVFNISYYIYDLFYVIYNIKYQLLSPIKEKINQYKGFLRRMHEGKESFCGWFYLCIYPTGKNICELPRALWYIWSFLSKYFHLRNRDKIKKAYSWNILALTKVSENKYILYYIKTILLMYFGSDIVYSSKTQPNWKYKYVMPHSWLI